MVVKCVLMVDFIVPYVRLTLLHLNPEQDISNGSKTLSSNHRVQWHKCSLCPAAFRYASGKSRHMKKHQLFHLTGKAFRYRHAMLSSGYIKKTSSKKTEPSEGGPKSTEAASQVFNCRFCGKVFNLLKYRNAHELNHHGKRPFKCMECGKGFKNHHHLNSHKLIHQRRIHEL
uniref:Uncharacterized LOC114477664 n=1 Tax=Gouania willdenowi TaxID=441366 RepID=A0A8C5DW28_GOUWI